MYMYKVEGLEIPKLGYIEYWEHAPVTCTCHVHVYTYTLHEVRWHSRQVLLTSTQAGSSMQQTAICCFALSSEPLRESRHSFTPRGR